MSPPNTWCSLGDYYRLEVFVPHNSWDSLGSHWLWGRLVTIGWEARFVLDTSLFLKVECRAVLAKVPPLNESPVTYAGAMLALS